MPASERCQPVAAEVSHLPLRLSLCTRAGSSVHTVNGAEQQQHGAQNHRCFAAYVAADNMPMLVATADGVGPSGCVNQQPRCEPPHWSVEVAVHEAVVSPPLSEA